MIALIITVFIGRKQNGSTSHRSDLSSNGFIYQSSRIKSRKTPLQNVLYINEFQDTVFIRQNRLTNFDNAK